MENNEYYSVEQTDEVERFLNYHRYKEKPAAIISASSDITIIINKTSKTFWINCPLQLDNAKQMAQIKQTSLNEIRKWHKKKD